MVCGWTEEGERLLGGVVVRLAIGNSVLRRNRNPGNTLPAPQSLFRNRLFQRHLLTGWRLREPGRAQRFSHRLGNNFGVIAAIAPLLPQSSGVGVARNLIMLKLQKFAGMRRQARRISPPKRKRFFCSEFN